MFYVLNKLNDKKLIESENPLNIIDYLKDNQGLVRCEIYINLKYANLKNTNLQYINLMGADLKYANLENTDLMNADLRYAGLRDANLMGADLMSADLRYASLQYADLQSTDLRSTDLRDANLQYVDLRNANLRSTDLQYADLRDADLKNVSLHNTVGDGKRIKTLQKGKYLINNYDDRLQIGCKNYTKKEWLEFDDEHIDNMEKGALDFWKEWKPKLISMGWL